MLNVASWVASRKEPVFVNLHVLITAKDGLLNTTTAISTVSPALDIACSFGCDLPHTCVRRMYLLLALLLLLEPRKARFSFIRFTSNAVLCPGGVHTPTLCRPARHCRVPGRGVWHQSQSVPYEEKKEAVLRRRSR